MLTARRKVKLRAVIVPHTDHLDMTEDGLVTLRCYPGATLLDPISCGFIGAVWWPCELGAEPPWFEREIWQLQGYWDREREMDERPWDDLIDMRWDRREVY